MFDVLHTSQPFDASDVVIDTGRLMLRRWRESDAEALYSYASDGRVSEMAMWPPSHLSGNEPSGHHRVLHSKFLQFRDGAESHR